MALTPTIQSNAPRRTLPEGLIPMVQRGGTLGIEAGTGEMMRRRIVIEHLLRLFSTPPQLTPEKK